MAKLARILLLPAIGLACSGNVSTGPNDLEPGSAGEAGALVAPVAGSGSTPAIGGARTAGRDAGGRSALAGEPAAEGGIVAAGGTSPDAGAPVTAGGSTGGAAASGAPSTAGTGGSSGAVGGSSLGGSAPVAGSAGEGGAPEAGAAGAPPVEVCECSTGACCDGCHVRPKTFFCGETERAARCTGGGARIERDMWNLFCDGVSAGECTRWGARTRYSDTPCDTGTSCVADGNQARCEP